MQSSTSHSIRTSFLFKSIPLTKYNMGNRITRLNLSKCALFEKYFIIEKKSLHKLLTNFAYVTDVLLGGLSQTLLV